MMTQRKWQLALTSIFFLLSLPLISFADASSSGMVPNAEQMLENLSSSYPALNKLVTGFCYLLGITLLIRGIYYLKTYGDLRTMTSSNTSLKTPMIYFLTAAVMMFVPSTVHMLNYTIFQQSSPIHYNQTSSTIDPALLKAIVGLVYLIGLFAFVRGWMILVAIAQQSSGGQNSFGKAMTHIVGGVIAMNIVGFTEIIWTTFGLQGIL